MSDRKATSAEIELTPEQQGRIAAGIRLGNLPYDGVAGMPPDWFPPRDRGEFLLIRSRLLREYTPNGIRIMIQYLGWDLMPPEGGYVNIPIRLMPDLWRLVDYKRAVDLGPVKGLELLLGEVLARNARAGSSYLERARRGGVKGAEHRREEVRLKHARVIQKARVLLQMRVSRRGLAGRIKKSGSDLSERQINRILKSDMN